MKYSFSELTQYDWAYYSFVRAMSEPFELNRDELETRMWLALLRMEAGDEAGEL